MDLVVNHPKPGEESYEQWLEEKTNTLKSLATRAKLVAKTLNTIPGFSCNIVQGAMYAFPQIFMPEKVKNTWSYELQWKFELILLKAIKAAEEAGQPADLFYAFSLLEETGICVIPGSGFGQMAKTYHFRTTILPQVWGSVLIDWFKVFACICILF